MKLQMFATLDEIITTNEKAFEGSSAKEQFTTISSKLNELGYEVLINNKKSAEFVPSARLSEAVAQREQFKGKVEELNSQLETLKKSAGTNEELKKQYQELIDKNTALLGEIEQTKINTQIVLAAKDAVNANDILAFIKMENIKVNAKGEVLGIDSEIERLKKEKPYLFNSGSGKPGKGGTDSGDGSSGNKTGGMNAMIRRAAGRI